MKRSRFTESQIVQILKEAEAGVSLPDLCRNAIRPREVLGSLTPYKYAVEVGSEWNNLLLNGTNNGIPSTHLANYPSG